LEEAERLAQHDPLTGLLNQRGLHARVAEMHGPRTVAFVDVDNLRELNGAHKQNWDGGDMALRALARLMHSVPGAVAARWGGDEFTMIFPDTGEREAAKSLISLNAQCQHEVHVGQIAVSFSAGVAFAADSKQHEAARQKALEAARTAKDSGRARVIIAGSGHGGDSRMAMALRLEGLLSRSGL
jgi:diguanylate cyclase (GGDEF)-like protein